jgi:hypothetical protein
MDPRFEAIIWWLNQDTPANAKISMDTVNKGLEKYRKVHTTDSGGEPDIGAVSRAALYRDFGTVEKMMDRTLKYLQDRDRVPPSALSVYLATDRKSRKSREEKKRTSFNGDILLVDLEQAVEQARTDRDDDELVARLEQLSYRYLKEPAEPQEIELYLEKAFRAARQGYEVGKESSKQGRRKRMLEEQMLCARSAAWAMIQMSRHKIEDDQAEADIYLSRAVTWKRNEEELAAALKLPLTATVARFHADRGSAVLDDDLEQSVVVLRDISTYLLAHKGKGAELNDKVRYHDLTSIIQRMCIVSGAAQGHELLSNLVDKHFPAPMSIDAVIEKLCDLYSNEGRGPEARRDIAALIDVRKMYDSLQAEYGNTTTAPADEIESAPVDELPDPEKLRAIISDIEPLIFMRISEFEALHALAFARFAIAARDIETQTQTAAKGLPTANELLTTASNLCYRAQRRTRDKAVGKVVLELLQNVQKDLSNSLPREEQKKINATWHKAAHPAEQSGDTGQESDNPIFLHLVQKIDEMLWKSMTSAPLNYIEATRLARTARDIDRYLSGSRKLAQDKGIKNDPA